MVTWVPSQCCQVLNLKRLSYYKHASQFLYTYIFLVLISRVTHTTYHSTTKVSIRKVTNKGCLPYCKVVIFMLWLLMGYMPYMNMTPIFIILNIYENGYFELCCPSFVGSFWKLEDDNNTSHSTVLGGCMSKMNFQSIDYKCGSKVSLGGYCVWTMYMPTKNILGLILSIVMVPTIYPNSKP